MLKLSKRMYQAERQALNDQIDHLQAICKEFEDLAGYNPKNYNLSQIGDKWNNYQDLIYDLQQDVKFLDDKFEKRDWSHQDYVQYDLITNNID